MISLWLQASVVNIDPKKKMLSHPNHQPNGLRICIRTARGTYLKATEEEKLIGQLVPESMKTHECRVPDEFTFILTEVHSKVFTLWSCGMLLDYCVS